MKKSQHILIGLDGLGWSEIGNWVNDGTLENLCRLKKEENASQLISTHPPWTPCAWPSLLSGHNPGKHGAFDFFTRDGYDKRLIDRSDISSPYLFEVADANDLTSVVINFPVTHPATQLDHSAVIPGYLAHEDAPFYPEHLRKEYETEYGEYVIYPEYGAGDDAVTEYVDVARNRRDMANFLDDQYDWDFMAVQFQVTDSIFHDLDDRNQIRQILEKVDRFIGDIIDLGGDDSTVIIASDHGMGDYNWTFYVNSWLAENGYCKTTHGEGQYFRQEKDALKGKSETRGKPSPLDTTIKTMVSTLSKVGLTPQRIHQGLSTVGLADVVESILPEDALVAAQTQVVDHANSTAFQLYFNSLGIHLNVEGRESRGTVSEEQYDEVRANLIENLKKIRDPNGELVFDDVRPREEIYEGKHLNDAPDILLFPRDYLYDVSGSILDIFRHYPHKNHKPEGILLTNLDIGTIDEARIYDIAPTIAAELGIPVDENTDGEVLTDVEEAMDRKDWAELAKEYDLVQQQMNSSSVEDRLKDLGYME